MPIDHLSLPVASVSRARDFYLKALAPIGYKLFMEIRRDGSAPDSEPYVVGLGTGLNADFWLQPGKPNPGAHVAFAVNSTAEVDAFYTAALEAGAKDNGPPGLRPHYHKGYYGAFVIDDDGYNIECVHHDLTANQ
ncbi:glyoxalase/bleomycin resistance protein/dioxygenase [Gonapodya prolifera JEL478]|uniref:Glyoxalase/bleomycin resistance protein/dioxygenase n=1 Tax=Gonapodya prolifera (strain JEL478) TaxID=1344416 RepID=A0A139ACA5_GONPJ|nr:glyoxalase/bleomycin resistance protein/dioxygenase [Gonapodya prolifera JEL478]|eukprot:KXS14053.1 glyoxalase/bleomycin resistance protein/dioxygenase [Gonapodya prolifera JEL478]